MKNYLIGLFAIAVSSAILSGCGGGGEPARVEVLKTYNDSLIYSIGMSTSKSMMRDQIEINPALIYQAMKDFQAGKTLITEDQMKGCLSQFNMQRQMKAQGNNPNQQQGPDPAAAMANMKAGQDFLASHISESGIKSTASGLQYKVIKGGSGPKPKVENTVEIHYKGTTLDGKEFDSSYSRGKTAEFPIGNLIKGWQEALPMMNTGSKWEIWCPSELAYGMNAPPNIGPNQVLKFEIELFKIVQ